MATLTWDDDRQFRFAGVPSDIPFDGPTSPWGRDPEGYSRVPEKPVPQPMPSLRSHPLQKILDKFTYRPNWEFFLFYDGGIEFNRLVLGVKVDCQNSYPPYRKTTVLHHRAVPTWKDVGTNAESFWQTFLFKEVLAVEQHECAEWFTVDGKKPFDPHKLAEV